MALAAGARLGPYEIIAPIGTGGMGEVYRARDTRLNRDVAIKILPPAIADHPVRRARFEREAQAISRLNHPNICVVYDVGAQDGVAYLVMEYIEGESLAERVRRGPVPPVTALRWAIQIVGALDAAHRRGIIHRDLKPANVMVTGQLVKLLDFGLAKLRGGDEAAAAGAVAAFEATISLTAECSVVGTLHYMAPEQLEGREIDARTDLFALGTVLYEMLTARKAFDGASAASVTAAILTAEPPPVSSSATGEAVAPPALDRVVRRALAKDPDDRWQTARDLMNELQWILDDGSRGTAVAAPSIGRGRRLAALAICAVAVLVGLAALSTLWGTKPPAAPIRLSFFRPVGMVLTNTGRPVLAISPDGTKIVFNANNQLYIRRLDAADAVPIPGTQGTGVQTPFFSSDGRWVAFFSAETHELKRIPVDGGVAVTICQSPAEGVPVPGPNGSPAGNFGASWTADNQILFATRDGVFRVPASGGTLQKIVTLKAGEAVYGPQMLPDGEHLLLTVTTITGADRWEKAQIIAQSLSSGARTVLIEGGADGRYLDTGHIIYAVGTTLFAVPVDVQSLRILGAPVTIVRGVRRAAGSASVNTGAAFAAISKTGDLAYIPDIPDSSIKVSVDLSGRVTALLDTGLKEVRVSPDGSQMVARHGGAWWIYSLMRRAAPRQLAAAEGANTNPLWTPDGTRIIFRSRRESGTGMVWQRADGVGSAAMLLDIGGRPVGWSRDGKTLFYLFEGELWSWKRGEKPRSLVSIDSPYASLSPDGQRVAFHTFEHGRAIPYLQSLSNPSERFQISPDGGHAPLWSPDGRKLFYVSGETNSLMAVDVQTTPTVTFGEAVVLMPEIGHGLALEDRYYDITPDGKQLLVSVPDRTDPRSGEVDVVLNWTEELKRLVPRQ